MKKADRSTGNTGQDQEAAKPLRGFPAVHAVEHEGVPLQLSPRHFLRLFTFRCQKITICDASENPSPYMTLKLSQGIFPVTRSLNVTKEPSPCHTQGINLHRKERFPRGAC